MANVVACWHGVVKSLANLHRQMVNVDGLSNRYGHERKARKLGRTYRQIAAFDQSLGLEGRAYDRNVTPECLILIEQETTARDIDPNWMKTAFVINPNRRRSKIFSKGERSLMSQVTEFSDEDTATTAPSKKKAIAHHSPLTHSRTIVTNSRKTPSRLSGSTDSVLYKHSPGAASRSWEQQSTKRSSSMAIKKQSRRTSPAGSVSVNNEKSRLSQRDSEALRPSSGLKH